MHTKTGAFALMLTLVSALGSASLAPPVRVAFSGLPVGTTGILQRMPLPQGDLKGTQCGKYFLFVKAAEGEGGTLLFFVAVRGQDGRTYFRPEMRATTELQAHVDNMLIVPQVYVLPGKLKSVTLDLGLSWEDLESSEECLRDVKRAH